jgi:hypothetical protein
MTRVTSLAAAVGAVLVLGACAGEGGQLATSPEAPAFQVGVGPACNLTDLRKATSALFGSKHAANAIAKQFTSKNQNSDLVTGFAYNLFEFIEAKREGIDTWVAGDPEKGAELTLQIIACSNVDYTDDDLEADRAVAKDAFELALDLAGTGTYAVRGAATTETSIFSKNKQKGLGAPSNFAAWFGGAGTRSLVIGYNISPADFSSEDEAGVYYDWSMIRPASSNTLTGLATISYCVGDGFEPTLNELRIQHHASTADGTVLPKGTAVTGVVCTTGVPVGLHGSGLGSFAARLFHGLVDAIRPAPLHASAFVKGPVSGTLGDFSPTGVVDPDTTLISFATLPTGGTTNTDLPLAVLVTAEGGTPWAGITVRITAAANNGATLAPCGNEAVTNDDGLAVFEDFQINSPGTVKLTAATIETAEGLDGDYDEVSLESTSFVITGAGNQSGCPVTNP